MHKRRVATNFLSFRKPIITYFSTIIVFFLVLLLVPLVSLVPLVNDLYI